MIEPTAVSVTEFADHIILEDIRFFELSGEVELGANETSEPGEAQMEVSLSERTDAPGYLVLIKATMDAPPLRLSTSVAGLYKYPEPFSLSEDDKVQFINRVAMIQLTPYIREGLATTAARLRVDAPLVPLVRAGTVQVNSSGGPVPRP